MNLRPRPLSPLNYRELTPLFGTKIPHFNSTVRSVAGNSSQRSIYHAQRRQFSPSCVVCFTAGRPKSESISSTVMEFDSRPNADSGGGVSSAIEDSEVDDFVTVENPANEYLTRVESETPDVNFAMVERSDKNDDGGSEVVGATDQLRVSDYGGEEDSNGEFSLPEELSRNVVQLSCESEAGGNCAVYLVGTAHVSEESCREVQAVISAIKPQVVFLELCPSRVAILTLKDLKVPTTSEMIDMWKKKQNLFGILYSWFLAKVADKLEVLPGSEFRVGFEEAIKCGSKVILGDRPVQVTLKRTWGQMPLRHKAKLLYSLLFQAVFLPSRDDLNKMLKDMDDVDMLTLVIQEMSKEFPTLMKTLVDERDKYMSSTLLKTASEHTSVVAVVGKGHLQGIRKYWQQPVEMSELLNLPPSGISIAKTLTRIGAAVTGVAIISGIYLAVKKQS